MPAPRVNSIVKAIDITDTDVAIFDIKDEDRFIYLGTIAQDPTRCIVEGIRCGKRIPYLRPDHFEEVGSDEF